jgi:hypothetical protein
MKIAHPGPEDPMSIGTILLIVLFVAAHLLMHRGHGGHGGHAGHERRRRAEAEVGTETGQDHRHSNG